MRLRATEFADGCWNCTLPSALISKDFQLRVALSVAWFTVRRLPFCTALAWPDVTKPGADAPQLPATQGTGSCADPAARRGVTSSHSARARGRSFRPDFVSPSSQAPH